MKRNIGTLLKLTVAISVVFFLFAACDKTKAASTGKKSSLKNSGSISFLIGQQVGAPLSESMPVIQELAKRTNTKLTFQNVPDTDLPTRVNTLVAARQYPDVIAYIGSLADTLFDDGVFLYLNAYINPELTPNIWKVMDSVPVLKRNMTSDRGDIRSIPQYIQRIWRCDWIINNKFLTELNMKAPTDLDSLFKYLVAVKNKYPDSVPFGVGPYYGGHNAVKRPVMFLFNVNNEFMLYNDDRYLFGPYEKQKEYSDALRFLNRLYQEKLIDQEFFSRTNEDTNSIISNNKMGIFCGWDDGYGQWGKNGTWKVDYIPNPPIKGQDGVVRVMGNARPGINDHFITNACKDISGVMAFYDYLYSDEGADLLNWGLKDVHWTTVNGQRQYTDLIMKHDQGYVIGRYSQGLAHPRLPTVLSAEAESLLNGEETNLHIEYIKQSTLFPYAPILSPTYDEEQISIPIMTEVSNLYKVYEARLIQEPASNFDIIFAEYMKALKDVGIEKLIEIKHAQYERYKKR